jgi:mannose-6-phosphate isomerase
MWRVDASANPVDLPGEGSGRIVLVTEGAVTAAFAGHDLELSRGQSAFVKPSEEVQLTGSGTAFVAGPGLA